MRRIYKIVCDIKLMHEYFLIDPDGSSVFSFAGQEDRLNFLYRRAAFNQPSVLDHIAFAFPVEMGETYRAQGLRLIPSYSGCRIISEVTASETGGNIRYTPISFPEQLLIAIRDKSGGRELFPHAHNFPLPTTFYFSNRNPFPSLSAPIPDFDAGKLYQQSDLASFGPGDTRQAFYSQGLLQWNAVQGDAFASTADLMLVSPQFTYQLPAGITSATFVLTDHNGNEIHRQVVENPAGLNEVALSITNPLLRKVEDRVSPEALNYSLEVATNLFITVHQLHFTSAATAVNEPGLIHLFRDTQEAASRLVDDEGFLATRWQAGTLIPPPVFEIRVKSRLVYWRYRNDEGKKLAMDPAMSEFLEPDDGQLISIRPRNATAVMTLFRKDSDNSFHYLPNPQNNTWGSLPDGRIYQEILVPESYLFPVQP